MTRLQSGNINGEIHLEQLDMILRDKYVHCDLDLGDITLAQGHESPLGQGQHGSKDLLPGHRFWGICSL